MRPHWPGSRRGRRGSAQPPDPHDWDRELIASFARRALQVTHRAIATVDAAEREDPDPTTLLLLYEVDHALARLRRLSENLLTVTRFHTPASTNRPMSLLSVARAAIAECNDFTMITLAAMPDAYIRPGTADEIAHILSELLDNALSASGGRTVHLTAAQARDRSVVYAVADDGPRPRPGLLDTLNSRLSEPPRLDATTARHLGMFVISMLSHRIGVNVEMTERDGGGTVVSVGVPAQLVLEAAPTAAAPALRGPRPGGARTDRWGPGPRSESGSGESTPGGLPIRARVTTPWSPGARPELRRPGAGALAGVAALDQASRPTSRTPWTPAEERTGL